MNWKKLISCEEVAFGRSVVLRFPAQYPFEDVVDFMIIEEPNSPLGLKLICCTGYHAGQTELVLPIEAKHGNGGLSVNWIKENWQKWVYCQCSLNEVSYIKHYPSNHGKEDA